MVHFLINCAYARIKCQRRAVHIKNRLSTWLCLDTSCSLGISSSRVQSRRKMENKERYSAVAWLLMLLVVRANSLGNLSDCKLNIVITSTYLCTCHPLDRFVVIAVRGWQLVHSVRLSLHCFRTKRFLDSKLF